MQLYVYNHDLEMVGIIDTAESIIWHRRYYSAGDFEVVTPATDITIELIQKQFLLTKPDSVECGIIERVTIDQTEEGEYIKAVGRFGSSILAKRIVFATTIINGTVENAMRQLVYENAINPDNADRIIPNLVLGTLNGYTETVQIQVSYRNILNTLTGIAQTSGIGYRIRLDQVMKKLVFETYKALDRSIAQSINPRVIFSNDYDNLLASTYETSDIEYSNVALVGGEGEGVDRKMVIVGGGIGLDRNEIFVNAKDIRMEDNVTEPEYYAMLAQKGAESLIPKVEYFEGSVRAESNVVYKLDYDLGDIVTIENTKWGKRINVQITEVTEVYDENGSQVYPVFGQATPSLSEALARNDDTSGSGGGSNEVVVTPNRALVSNSLGKVSASSVSDAELGCLSGVSSNVQTQLNGKAASSHTHTASQITDFLNKVYPVGAIYMSVVNTSPATLFGGTWQAFGAGRTLVGFDSSQTEFNASEKTGGAKTHTLTESEMPSHTHVQNSHNHTQNSHNHTQNEHNHTQNAHSHVQHDSTWMNMPTSVRMPSSGSFHASINSASGNNPTKDSTATNIATTATNIATTATNIATTATNQNTGGGQAHNNLQPYITVYMWKRTA